MVDACLRDGRGGSPTVVLQDTPARGAHPGASHTAYVTLGGDIADIRFFTSTGELPACGHGTVAALTWLADRLGRGGEFTLRISGRILRGWVDGSRAWFEQAPVRLRDPGDVSAVLAALGLGPAHPGVVAASTGRWRLLIPVTSASRVDPDLPALRSACDAAGLLGCFVYHPVAPGRYAARMFAPSIGVPEDIANVNSSSGLAAALGVPEISVDMGDRLGHPATILVRTTGGRLQAGGEARIRT
ncbi:PhzF family phenazine biosynthesis protein [Actinoplanes sp. NPDC020271]|uniref:PhzF family phenazine biosynthesis protein n=1 Tax=Actinoplanes sp. NPDC020271 TaxID=3363896 RepID=UPI0037A16382